MNALVTGGAGFIGSALTRGLVEEGWTVRVLDNFLTSSREDVPERAHLVEGDLRDLGTVTDAAKGADIVFHQGAVRSVPRSVDEPILVDQCNVQGTLNVLVASSEVGVGRVVYASSSSVYGDVPEGLNHEDLPVNPMSPYAASKLAGEMYCRVWASLGKVSTVSLRYFNVFGPGQSAESKYSAVFPAFISSLLAGRPPELHWDGEQSRDFSYIDDVVTANLLAAKAGPDATGSAINIAGGKPRTVNQVLRSISDVIGRWIEPVTTPRRSGDVRRTHADISRAKDLLGWKPAADWDGAVRSTVEWFTSQSQVASA